MKLVLQNANQQQIDEEIKHWESIIERYKNARKVLQQAVKIYKSVEPSINTIKRTYFNSSKTALRIFENEKEELEKKLGNVPYEISRVEGYIKKLKK